MAHQIFEQGIFLQSEVYPLTASGHFARGRVQCQIVDLEHAGALGGPAAKQGANAGKQLVDSERLGEVIVCSCIKALDPLIDLRLGGQNQNGVCILAWRTPLRMSIPDNDGSIKSTISKS